MFAAATKRCIVSQAKRASFVSRSKTVLNSGNAPLLSAFRFQSSITGACPHQSNEVNEAASTSTKPRVKFVNVPKLPFFGSLIPKYSNASKFDPTRTYQVWYENREKFGDFYCIGIPVIGKSITGDAYILTDPNEFMKVLRKEGPFPFGVIEFQWPFVEYYKDKRASETAAGAGLNLFSRGLAWQRLRRFMQTDLLHPSAAKGYVPGMIRASQIASEGAPLHAKDIKKYTAYCSFDLFSSVMFGEFNGIASGKSGHEANERFCYVTVEAMSEMSSSIRDIGAKLKKKIGLKTKDYKYYEENLTESRRIAYSKMKDFKLRKDNGELLNDFEKMSYASLSIDRFYDSLGEDDALNEEEVTEMLVIAMVAAVDTTSALLNWALIHLAMNPEVQETLRRETEENIASSGVGSLTEECFTKSNNIYLDAFLRENHRITKPIGVNLMKENIMDEVEIHGKKIPKGNVFILESRSVGMDPNFVKDPDVFDPTRWFQKEVQKRKGTPAEILDHPLYRDAFSAGARKCPGSRVASYEAKTLLSQLVLDWEISFADNGTTKPETWKDIPYYHGLTIQPDIPELSFKPRQ